MNERRYIDLAVVMSGGAVLAVEILGTRLIGPFYGTSLYLWSALIGVTLGALSLGYALGGRLADRGPRLGAFAALIAGAGLWIAAIPWLRYPLLAVAAPLGLRTAVLFAAMVLFFAPLTLLGMTTPYAVRLRAASVETSGRAAGGIYALSTIASLAAALLTGFILIPLAGASRLAFLIGAALVVTALAGPARSKGKGVPAMVAIVAVVAAAVFAAPGGRANPDAGLVAIAESPYAEIRVVDGDGTRLMLIDGMVHAEVDTTTWDSPPSYIDVLELAADFYEYPGTTLLVGLGGGTLAKRFVGKGWNVDVVEIDPEVTRVAERYFGFRPSHARVFHRDGREFMIEHEETYDLIILDAFGSSSIPFHLVTKEAFALCKARLAPGGVLALNVIAVGWRDELVRALAATLREKFSKVLVLPMAEPPDQLGNLTLLASDGDLEIRRELPVPMDRFSPEYNRAHAWDNRFEIDPAGERIITDDRNPVDLWTERINLANRKMLHEYFGSRGIGW
jgi:spermidine synthase